MNPSYLIPHTSYIPTALIPIYHWRGGRPRLLDLETDQDGSLIGLLLTREGDCCLLPIAWLYDQPRAGDDDPLRPTIPQEKQALDQPTLDLILNQLTHEGWEISGRLDMHFTGLHTTPHFWQNLHPLLSPTP